MTSMTSPSAGASPPTQLAMTLAGVFLASMIGTLALWASVDPDCSRSEIVAFEAHCADAATTP